MLGGATFWLILLVNLSVILALLCCHLFWKLRAQAHGPDAQQEGNDGLDVKSSETISRLQKEYCGKLFDAINQGVAIHKIIYNEANEPVDFEMELVNPAFLQLTGMSMAQVLGKRGEELRAWHGDQGPAFWTHFKQVVHTGSPVLFDAFLPHLSKYFKFFCFSISRNFFGTVFQDETELQRQRRSLAEEKETLSVTLGAIQEAVITVDADNAVVLMNAGAETLTGWTGGEALGRNLDEILQIVPCEQYQSDALISSISGSGETMTLIAKNGERAIVEISRSPLRDAHKASMGTVIVCQDITEKHRLEQEVAKTERLESLGILAGGIAHDFNNILTAILGNISLAQMFVHEPQKLQERLGHVEKATEKAQDLTQQLLTFSKGGAPVRQKASLKDLLVDSATFILGGSNVRCVFELDSELWNAEVDKSQISQVIQNLVLNADQAMPEGGHIIVQAENVSFDEHHSPAFPGGKSGHYVMITVMDAGIGIPESYMTKIFDPFFTTKHRGNGLGLAIAYSIIRGHDGHITVSSTPGKGTTFTIYLPAVPGMPPEEATEQETLIFGSGRILIMDDDESILEFLKVLLEKLGYQGAFALSGEEAVDLYREAMEKGQPFDAVILDLTVPGGMGGAKTLEELKSITSDIKAIVSSGHSLEPVMSEYMASGFSAVLAKPYKPFELSHVLHDVLKK